MNPKTPEERIIEAARKTHATGVAPKYEPVICMGCGETSFIEDDPEDPERVIIHELHRMPCPTSAKNPAPDR